MKIIIGLGNPGSKYDKTRHNVGFDLVSFYADSEKSHFSEWKTNKKFDSEIAEGKINGEKIILAKPQTFMNDSGRAVFNIAKFYKVAPRDILVVHDDIDLPLGKIRIKKTGSSGGHRGIESIIESLGSEQFIRLKIGVGFPENKKIDAAKLVLKKISKVENKIIDETKKRVAEAISMIMENKEDEAMNRFN